MNGRSIPTLGYRSRTEAAAALADKGLDDHAIAARLGTTRARVAALRWWAGHRKRKSSDRIGRAWAVKLPECMREALAEHAARRGIRAPDLARRILNAVLADNLVDAILDDAEDTK